jgi:hypothetical protein
MIPRSSNMYIFDSLCLFSILHTGRPNVDDNDTSKSSSVMLQRIIQEKLQFCFENILHFDMIE